MNALVTVTNKKYFAGTQVLIYSFLKNNPNFKGDIIVIHDHLSINLKEELMAMFPVKFEQVSCDLTNKLDQLVRECNHLKNRVQRFWSLELFRLKGYNKLLFLDSDILCRGELSELWEIENEFSACPDLTYYQDRVRNKLSFEKKPLTDQLSNDWFEKVFNAGVFLWCRKVDQSNRYEKLLELLTSKEFFKVTSGHTDQYVLNRSFERNVNWLGPQFNFILRDAAYIREKTKTAVESSLIWHYTRNPKPWYFKRLLTKKIKGKKVPKGIKQWIFEYSNMQKEHKLFNSITQKIILKFLQILV